jgi:hypothetical protein
MAVDLHGADGAKCESVWRSLRRSLLFLAGAGGTIPALAGPPLETDDPDTPDDGHWEVNLATTLEKRGDLRELTPLLDINYGYGGRIQFKIKPRFVVLDSSGNSTRTGAGNIQLGVKWRFLDEDTNGIAMSIYPQADLNPPSRSVERGLVSDGSEWFLPLEIARTLGRTRLYSEIGFNWREHRNDEWVFGLAADHLLSDDFRIAAELRDVAQSSFKDHELAVRAGFKWTAQENWTLLVSLGQTLREPRGEERGIFSYFGVQHTF